MTETIPHWLTKQAYLAPNQPAIELENGTTLTFLELKQKSQIFARKLASLGVKNGDHIGVLSTNDVRMIIAIHALSYLGSVGVLLNTRLTTQELNYQLRDAKVSIVLTLDDLYPKAEQLDVEIVRSFSMIDDCMEKKIPLVTELNLEDDFTIIYTSGTTGFPKGVVHTYGNHWWSAISSALNLGLSKEDKWLATLPMFHVGGLSIYLKSVIYGMPVMLFEKFHVGSVHHAIMHRGVTMISVVTIMVQRLMEKLGEEFYPEHFRCMLLGGGPAPKALLEKAKEKLVPVFQSYGMTETSSQIATLSPHDALNKVGSSGKPLVPAQLDIINPDHENIGEILVKGPMVTKGYFQNQAANEGSFKDGWLATGDLGYLDEEGFLYVVDRRKDLIISGGENIYPSEVESVIAGLEQVKEVGVVGVENEKWGQVPYAFIVPNDPKLDKEDVYHFLQTRLAAYKIPNEIYFVEELPRNASNKLVRSKLLNLMNK
ncbi:o-succinylbenzoate--CoA ligase [Ornithinibacillus sp. L9]|uniref:2-succinylbenzoate--CoA ligase n=1 Tax=Ornithinibacillus caprae TaxID=2678566 RepID=A0A6N8FMS1_9BACI|nr:o-succinylbenzoate--CoA ligase [Ornithinibacillus caprae]MUK90046.1 o-succinylbenzoate--CoA ligase [Ornithinibacillus caprae]